MSDTNRTQVTVRGFYGNNTLAVTVPLTGTSDLGATPEYATSEVVRSDRQVSSLQLVNVEVGGSVDTELSYKTFHNFASRAALMPDGVSPWTGGADQHAETEITQAGTGEECTVSSTIIQPTDLSFGVADVGSWVRIEQVSTGEFFYGKVANSATNFLQLESASGAVSGTLRIHQAGHRVNGTTMHELEIEKAYLDTGIYELITGAYLDEMTVTASNTSIMTASYSFVAREHSLPNSAQSWIDADGSPEGGAPPFESGTGNIGPLLDNIDLGIVTEFSFTIANNLRRRNALGVVGATSVGSGECTVTGSVNVYFEDKANLDRLLNNTQFSLSFGGRDAHGNAIIFDFPAVKFSSGLPEVSGKNEDVMLSLEWQAFRDETLGYTVRQNTFSG